MITRLHGCRSGDDHNPKVFPQIMLMLAHNFPEASAEPVTNHGATETPTRNKTGASYAGLSYRESSKDDEPPPFAAAGRFDTTKI
jgi:hypothetical protein